MNFLDAKMAELLETKRGICCETAAAHGVISNGNLIGFEFRDRGQVRYVKWRGKEKKIWAEPSGETPMLWNLDCLRTGEECGLLIITEGEFDALSWLTAGAVHVVSVPNGAPSRPGHGDVIPSEDDKFAFLWNGDDLIPELLGIEKIILSTDADKPGRILAEELAIRLGKRRCHVVEYPDGCKDANEVLIEHGVDGVLALMDSTKAVWPSELVPITEIAANPFSVAHSTGWAGLDDHMRIVPPELCVITGLPNAGKSQWVWALAANLARKHDWKCAILQFEDGVTRIKRTLSDYAHHWRTEVGDADDWMRRHFYMPIPDDSADVEGSDKSVAWILDRMEEAGWRHGCRAVIIDPWNEIEHDWKPGVAEHLYISRMLKLIKAKAREYSLAVFLVAHPTKASADKGIEDLTLCDVSGGMAWNAKADHGVVMARAEENSDEIHVRVSKSRDQSQMGFPGIVTMRFLADRGTYEYVGKGAIRSDQEQAA